jgi:hypothetical protein
MNTSLCHEKNAVAQSSISPSLGETTDSGKVCLGGGFRLPPVNTK